MTTSGAKKHGDSLPRRGLVIRRASAKYARPASGAETPVPLAASRSKSSLPAIEIATHRTLAASQRALAERVAAEPALAIMLLINPVLALERMGVQLSSEIAHHILHTLQHPKAMRDRRDVLEASLQKALGETAHPTDPTWNEHLLFELRNLAPLAIGHHQPVFLPPIGDALRKGLDALRPPATARYPEPRRLPPRSRIGSVPWSASLRRLDLAAPAPSLPQAPRAPATVPLEDLWFYKDLDAVVHDALELGVIQRGGFPFHTPDSFRQILEGKKANAFTYWIKSVRFKSGAPS
jgi:hypothetical protein